MDIYNWLMLILCTMVHNNVTVNSNGNSGGGDVEVELKNLPAIPPGFHFLPSSCLFILEYLVKKIIGVPLPSDMVKVRDGIQRLDPEQHRFEDDFAYCMDNEAYYITNKTERNTEGGGSAGGSQTSTVIKTPSGYWREKKKDIAIYDGDDQIVGYKKCYVFCRDNNDETSWRMDEFTVNPEIVPTDAREQTKETIACRIRMKQPKPQEGPSCAYEEFKEEEFEEEEEEEYENE